MTNIELSEKIAGLLNKTKAKKIKELVAVHFNLLDLSQDMYIEIKNGVLSVMPYEYIDRQAAVTVSSEELVKIIEGKTTVEEAYKSGVITVEGDIEKVKIITTLIGAEKPAAKKTEAKKPEAKKEAPKADAKPAAAAKTTKAPCKKNCKTTKK